jgi:hypothetical protein
VNLLGCRQYVSGCTSIVFDGWVGGIENDLENVGKMIHCSLFELCLSLGVRPSSDVEDID